MDRMECDRAVNATERFLTNRGPGPNFPTFRKMPCLSQGFKSANGALRTLPTPRKGAQWNDRVPRIPARRTGRVPQGRRKGDIYTYKLPPPNRRCATYLDAPQTRRRAGSNACTPRSPPCRSTKIARHVPENFLEKFPEFFQKIFCRKSAGNP